MRTAESRDLMVTRVQAAFAKHRTFEGWPEIDAAKGNISASVEKPVTEAGYVAALHEICAAGEPIGRAGGALIGKRIAEDAPQPQGKRLASGRGKGA